MEDTFFYIFAVFSTRAPRNIKIVWTKLNAGLCGCPQFSTYFKDLGDTVGAVSPVKQFKQADLTSSLLVYMDRHIESSNTGGIGGDRWKFVLFQVLITDFNVDSMSGGMRCRLFCYIIYVLYCIRFDNLNYIERYLSDQWNVVEQFGDLD